MFIQRTVMALNFEKDSKEAQKYFDTAYNSYNDDNLAIDNYQKCIEIFKKYYNLPDDDTERKEKVVFNIESTYINLLNHIKDEKQKLFYYDEMIKLLPFEGKYAKAFYLLCQYNDYAEAAKYFLECIPLSKNNTATYRVFCSLINCYDCMEQFNKSLLAADELTKTMPHEGQCKKAEILIKQQKYYEALVILEKALKTTNNSLFVPRESVLAMITDCCKALKDTEKVLFYMDKNKNYYGSKVELLCQKGEYLQSVNEYKQALVCYLKAEKKANVATEPMCNMKELKTNIASCYKALGKEKKAKKYEPKSPNSFNLSLYIKQKTEELNVLVPKEFSREEKNLIADKVEKYTTMACAGFLTSFDVEINDERIVAACDSIAKWTTISMIELIKSNIEEETCNQILSNIAFVVYEIFVAGLKQNYKKDELIALIDKEAEKHLIEEFDKLEK